MNSWYRNSFYHRFLLARLPAGAARALDVGCGRGEFAARLAEHVPETTGIDLSPVMVDHARARHSGIAGLSFRAGDITRTELAPGSYDYISCVAGIHHMPFEPVLARLRDALAPGGVLAVLGLYRTETLTDRLVLCVAVPVNVLISAFVAIRAPRSSGAGAPAPPPHPVQPPTMTLAEIRAGAARQLPGAVLRRRLFWRYSLVYRRPKPDQ